MIQKQDTLQKQLKKLKRKLDTTLPGSDRAQELSQQIDKLQQQIDNQAITPPPPEPDPLRDAYVSWLLGDVRQISLAGVDPKAATGKGQETSLNLGAIYTALLTFGSEQREFDRPDYAEREKPLRLLERQGHQMSALAQLNRHAHLVLLGDPGSGKSTFVNFVTLCLAGEYVRDAQTNLALLTAPLPKEDGENEDERQVWEHGLLLPIRVILRDFAVEGLPVAGEPATVKHLWDFIAKTLREATLDDFILPLRQMLMEQGGLLLLDGLDEVPQAHARRVQIKQAVEDFTRVYRRCRVLVTSRTYAYQKQDWRLQGFEEAVLAPFTQGQIHRFVDRWYAQIAPLRGMRADDARARAQLLTRVILTNDRLYSLAERPLLLTLMTSLHAWRGGSLPEKREELYNDTVELLLDWWESHKVKNPEGQVLSLTEVLKLGREGMDGLRRLINSLAYQAHAGQTEPIGTADIPENTLAGGLMRLSQDKDVNPLRLAEYLRDRAGLLVSHGVGVYTFPHRTFQEYLAACHLTNQDDYPDNIAELARRDPNRWREVVLLAGAKAARGAASTIWSLVEALCWQEFPSWEGSEVGFPSWEGSGVGFPSQEGNWSEDAWGALLAGQALVETTNLKQISPRNRSKLERIRQWLTAILTEQAPFDPSTSSGQRSAQGTFAPFPAVERALAGNILAQLGDPRPGVGVRADGLPDILWCEVPAGTFLMGSDKIKDPDAYEDEQPQHTVRLSFYQMSRYPVTNAQYQAFVADGGYTKQWQTCWSEEGWQWKEEHASHGPEKYGGEFDLPNHPVVGVSWYEAAAFCNWLTQLLRKPTPGPSQEGIVIRLPSDAEWEKAARGEDGRIFPWGNDTITPEHANYADTGLGVTSAVGCFPRDVSPYGCEDMAGNVVEWCQDWYDGEYYTKSPGENPTGPASGSNRVGRGGSWYYGAGYCRTAYRPGSGPGSRYDSIGFRLLRTPS